MDEETERNDMPVRTEGSTVVRTEEKVGGEGTGMVGRKGKVGRKVVVVGGGKEGREDW